MKKNIFKSVMTVVVVSFLSGCAMHQGNMANSAALSSNNYSYVKKDAIGTAKATYVLGIGGHSKISLVNDAKKHLLSDHPLKDNEALVNLTVSWKNTFIPPFIFSYRCILTADIVEFK